MIELIFSACLLSAPMECKDVHLTFAETQVTPMACMMMGQIHIAEWTASHPKYRPGRYRCAPVREAQLAI